MYLFSLSVDLLWTRTLLQRRASQPSTNCFCVRLILSPQLWAYKCCSMIHWRIWRLRAMENVTPLWLTVAWRPADVKACLVQTAGVLCCSSAAGGSRFICNRQEAHRPFFAPATFLTTGFTCMHHRTLSIRGNHPTTTNEWLFTLNMTGKSSSFLL